MAETGERFWRRDYWLGTVDPRPLAIFRIALGIILLYDLFGRVLTMSVFLTDDGVLPRFTQTEAWARGLFDLTGSHAGVAALLAVGALATLALTVGLQTRAATFVTWLVTLSVQNRNLAICNGGDDLAKVMLFWALFTDLGGAYSVDARRRGGPREVPALGARLMQWQLVALYFAAAVWKVRGNGHWLDGDALYQALQMTGFVRPPGAWVLEFPTLCRVLTWLTLAIELALPLLLLATNDRARLIGIASGVGLQLGILVMMRVGMFTTLMIAACVLFVRSAWLPALELAPSPPAQRARPLVALVLGGHFALTVIAGVIDSTPRLVDDELKWVQLNQSMDLFGNTFPLATWQARGENTDGRSVDALAVAIPELQPHAAWIYSRWTKLSYKSRVYWEPIGDYLCRRYRAVTGTPLTTIELSRDRCLPNRPGVPPPPVEHQILLHKSCPALAVE